MGRCGCGGGVGDGVRIHNVKKTCVVGGDTARGWGADGNEFLREAGKSPLTARHVPIIGQNGYG